MSYGQPRLQVDKHVCSLVCVFLTCPSVTQALDQTILEEIDKLCLASDL